MSRPAQGVVAIASLDVRRRPDHRSEMTSQLLLGEVVRLLRPADHERWWRVEGPDGYVGWARSWGWVPATARRARVWLAKARWRVICPVAQVVARPGGGGSVSPLYLNSRVIAGARRGRHRPVELPDGRRGWVEAGSLARGDHPPDLLDRVRSLLGVPYLWGGRTPAGFDCSGFTQQVLAERGVALPRDAAHQRRASRRLARGESDQPGDLVFFAPPGRPVGHVGIGLGGGYFAQCRGVVRISSVDPENPLCDRELLPQFVGWGRPLRRS